MVGRSGRELGRSEVAAARKVEGLLDMSWLPTDGSPFAELDVTVELWLRAVQRSGYADTGVPAVWEPLFGGRSGARNGLHRIAEDVELTAAAAVLFASLISYEGRRLRMQIRLEQLPLLTFGDVARVRRRCPQSMQLRCRGGEVEVRTLDCA